MKPLLTSSTLSLAGTIQMLLMPSLELERLFRPCSPHVTIFCPLRTTRHWTVSVEYNGRLSCGHCCCWENRSGETVAHNMFYTSFQLQVLYSSAKCHPIYTPRIFMSSARFKEIAESHFRNRGCHKAYFVAKSSYRIIKMYLDLLHIFGADHS